MVFQKLDRVTRFLGKKRVKRYALSWQESADVIGASQRGSFQKGYVHRLSFFALDSDATTQGKGHFRELPPGRSAARRRDKNTRNGPIPITLYTLFL